MGIVAKFVLNTVVIEVFKQVSGQSTAAIVGGALGGPVGMAIGLILVSSPFCCI